MSASQSSTPAAQPPVVAPASLAQLHPAYFALVMATGIVSIASHLVGAPFVPKALFALNLVFYPVLWIIAGILIHDHDDPENNVSGGMKARDRLIALNGCTTETKPVEPSPCVEYQGCKAGYPVIWCETTTMQGHSRQDKLSVPAIYNFFAQF